MGTPRIISRAEHTISRRDIDPDALRVLTRLRQVNHTAYLVGGSVRDLLLGRHPKDFDIGTSAHPYEVKRIFRNCWIIGRRFRLAHVKFGSKTIEVATFRRQVSETELATLAAEARIATAELQAEVAGTAPVGAADAAVEAPRPLHRARMAPHGRDHLIHRDNTFGTPEQDAFRRDFTVNALFYDIATFSIIDYVGGIEDLHARIIRCIGDPDVRFREDPVRMLRAIVLAARLDFTVDPPVVDAIRRHAAEITRSAQARLLDELYKILRSGASERAFRELADIGLLRHIAPELLGAGGAALSESLAELDRYRRRFPSAPDTLTNAVLLGSLLVPRGFTGQRPRRIEIAADVESEAAHGGRRRDRSDWRDPASTLGLLPLARRDLERLGQILSLQRRLLDAHSSARARRALMHRSPFQESLTWLEIHGRSPDSVERWRELTEPDEVADVEAVAPEERRRRRRRGRGSRGRRFTERAT